MILLQSCCTWRWCDGWCDDGMGHLRGKLFSSWHAFACGSACRSACRRANALLGMGEWVCFADSSSSSEGMGPAVLQPSSWSDEATNAFCLRTGLGEVPVVHAHCSWFLLQSDAALQQQATAHLHVPASVLVWGLALQFHMFWAELIRG
jgi:hypothetical protein